MNIFVSLLFSSIGLAYSVFGKKRPNAIFLISGIVLMFYPYFVQQLLLSIFLGLVFTIIPFIFINSF